MVAAEPRGAERVGDRRRREADQERALEGEGQPLDQAPFTVTIYTPLYYWAVAGLRAAAGPGFGPGRILSTVAVIAAAALVGTLTAQRLRRPGPGLFAALLFLGLGVSGIEPFPWSALYKEDLLGVALSLGAVTALTAGSGGSGDRREMKKGDGSLFPQGRKKRIVP